MKKLFIVANWKSYKTKDEAISWLDEFKIDDSNLENKEIIVCPSFTLLPDMKKFILEKNLPIKLGTQTISPFEEGAYTGEISTRQAVELVTHSIVGHSERRRYFHETEEYVIKELTQIIKERITPILCISDMKQLDYYLMQGNVIVDNADKIIFVYEPPSAISGGGAYRPEDPETANKNAAEISNKIGKKVITLYGGSVNTENATELFSKEYIDGGLVGQASLDLKTFSQIIENA